MTNLSNREFWKFLINFRKVQFAKLLHIRPIKSIREPWEALKSDYRPVLSSYISFGDCPELRQNFAQWTREEEAEPEHVDDMASDSMAFDRSIRSYDQDGRLRVGISNISKASVCPYWGHEIPGWQELGLNPDRQYHLLRDPDELKKAAQSSNGIPLIYGHIPATPDDHPADRVVGAVGTDAEFDGPYLKNSLIIWTREGIDAVESEEPKELSCAYRYDPDMTPGNFDGTPYDGAMRNADAAQMAGSDAGD